jgi:putative colanic acid biosynthesis UDP-glucose lipid carrier transferase
VTSPPVSRFGVSPAKAETGASQHRGPEAGTKVAAPPSKKALLRRRQSLSATIEATLHGASVVILAYVLALQSSGAFRLFDLLFVLALLAAMAVTYDAVGVFRRHAGLLSKALHLLKAWLLSIVFVSGCGLLLGFPADFHSSGEIALFAAAGFAIQVIIHGLVTALPFRLHVTDKPAVIVGAGKLAKHTYERINSNQWIPETVLGVVCVDEGDEIEANADALPVLGTLDNIEEILRAEAVRSVYVVTPLGDSAVLQSLYSDLLARSIDVHWIPNIFQLSVINPNVKEIGGMPIITLSESPLAGEWSVVLKSLEDKFLSAIALLLTSPLILGAAIAVKMDSSGPVIFKQRRTGWDGKVFSIWKFRTMYVHEPEEGYLKQASFDDARITRVGRFLRRSSIDELPQLFNVLMGHMSLVGPRPHATEHNDLYSKQIRTYLARHRIKPGITGLAQVAGFRGETRELNLMEERVKRDIEYINNWSLSLDLWVLFRTLFVAFGARAY